MQADSPKILTIRYHMTDFSHKLSTYFSKMKPLTNDEIVVLDKIIIIIGMAVSIKEIFDILDPELFFTLCYYIGYYDSTIDRQKLSLYNMLCDAINTNITPDRIHDVKLKYIIENYSPLGAIIVNDAQLSVKRDFISKLMSFGFVPTQCDIDLNGLILYDAIPNLLKHVIMLLLHNIDLLNHDIRVYIINILLHELMINNCPLI